MMENSFDWWGRHTLFLSDASQVSQASKHLSGAVLVIKRPEGIGNSGVVLQAVSGSPVT